MAFSIPRIIAALEAEFPAVTFVLDARFGACAANHRQKIREEIFKRHPDRAVMDLSTTPNLKDHFVSIAHCLSLGGFALSEWPIGFDIEETERVQPGVARRIQHPDDQPLARSSAVWAAKESAFKGLRQRQPAMISDIAILEWKILPPLSLGGEFYGFQTSLGEGKVWVSLPWTIAIFRPVSN